MDRGAPSTLRQRKIAGGIMGFVLGGIFQLFLHPHGLDTATLLFWPAGGLLGYLHGRYSTGRFLPDILRGLAVSLVFWAVWFVPYWIAHALADRSNDLQMFFRWLFISPLVSAIVTAYISPLIVLNALVLWLNRNEDDQPAPARHA